MGKLGLVGVSIVAACGSAARAPVEPATLAVVAASGCGSAGACVEAALVAMGGRERIAGVATLRLDMIMHTAVMEQSYRQAPFLTSYERDRVVVDLVHKRLRVDAHATWPESDNNAADSDTTMIGSLDGAVVHDKADSPAGRGDVERSREELELGPLTMLLTAAAAPDLRRAPSEQIRAAHDDVVAFTWRGVAARIALDPVTHLPDAVETTQQLDDFWFYWGDVHRRIYFDNWHLVARVHYPTSEIEERNGAVWQSRQVLGVELDAAIPADSWKMDAAAAAASLAAKGWTQPYASTHAPVELAPGIELYAGSWNVAVIVQRDGLVVLEAPISGAYLDGVVAAAQQRHPGVPVVAVLTTSDSWPHVGAVRACVAKRWPIYILDTNRPLLERLIAAPHTLVPDELAASPSPAELRSIANGTTIGDGDNQLVVYPIHGAATDRQYMVYFPHHKLLYASDTLVLNDDGSLYDPELMDEVVQAVAREHLDVDRVYAMHQPPIPYQQAAALVAAAHAAKPPAVASTPAAPAGPMAPLAGLVGSFACTGAFANGTPIQAAVRVDLDARTGAIITHHDDTLPPALYHAVEVWAYQPGNKHYLATITDDGGGVRQFVSAGLLEDTLTWIGMPGQQEEFVYTLTDASSFRLDWRVNKAGTWKVGDSLTCTRTS